MTKNEIKQTKTGDTIAFRDNLRREHTGKIDKLWHNRGRVFGRVCDFGGKTWRVSLLRADNLSLS